jgi:hypothetical protein
MRYNIRKGEGYIHYIIDTRTDRRVKLVYGWEMALKVCREYNLFWAEFKKTNS